MNTKKFAMGKLVLTRKCNIQCPFCTVPLIPTKDADHDDVMKAIEVIDRWADFVCIQGGEPTISPHIDDVIRFLSSKRTNDSWVLITNGIRLKDESYRQHLKSIGLDSISISWDSYKSWTEQLIKDATKELSYVNVSVIYDKQLVGKIVPLLEHLTSLGASVVFGPYMYNRTGKRWFTGPKNDDFAIPPSMKPRVQKDVDEIVERYDEFNLIPSKEFLMDITKHGLDMSWKCSEWTALDVNNDLHIQFCQDIPTSKYTVFDLDTKYDEIVQAHHETVADCDGCFCACYTDIEYGNRKRQISH